MGEVSHDIPIIEFDSSNIDQSLKDVATQLQKMEGKYQKLSDRAVERESQVNELNLLVSNMGSKITQMKENYDQQLEENVKALKNRGDSPLSEAVWAKIDEMEK